MSALKDRLRTDLTAAMKARDELRSSTIRMAMTAVTNAEVAGKTAKELTDDEVVGVLSSEAKRRREAAAAFDEGDRPERAQRERDEAGVLADYLPTPLTDEEIRDLVSTAIADAGVGDMGMKGMGKVMGLVTPHTAGRADGGAVAAEVRRQLG